MPVVDSGLKLVSAADRTLKATTCDVIQILRGPSSGFVVAVNFGEPTNLRWLPVAFPDSLLFKYTERMQTQAFYRKEGALEILKAGRRERPTQERSRECAFLFLLSLSLLPPTYALAKFK